MAQGGNDFNAIRISLASPEQIRLWSYGEVTKPETINYRTLRPEKDGLFCERIFGPTKDWECYCGKYKKIRHRGIICDRCGVEIARAKVRRERMGHIQLAAPVAHIWFSKGTPSRLGLMLDLSPKNLDRVLYFAQYLITNVDQELVADEVDRLQNGLDAELDRMEMKHLEDSEAIQAQIDAADENGLSEEQIDAFKEQLRALNEKYDSERAELDAEIQDQIDDMEGLAVGGLLTESRFRDLRDSCGDVFEAGMGAEAVLELLRGIDLDVMRDALQEEIRTTSGQRHKKAVKRLRVVEAFRKSENKPDWMIFTMLPVLPPELRPMVQLDGGRFATSDLNDLYRRVINRNNRLKRLIDLMAPEIIVRNEKRMLQEAVDALVDNGRRGRAVAGSHNHKLKSLSDLLRGKQGRFRQNLLGKRVDYSGRSVIIVGPELKLNECGLPRKMALELFKPFVMNKLVINGYAHNIKSAKRLAESERPEVWDILERVVQDRPVLLNRAPTLHRLGIQAFQPVLIEGSAIRLHPLVTTAFNADFDGDQMAVHVPLSKEAVWEAKRMMLSTNNMLAPSSGEPIVSPTLDMVLGCFYMTQALEGARGEGREFADVEDARLAYELGLLDLRAPVKVRSEKDDAWMETTPGRIVFNDALPEELGFYNAVIDRGMLNEITSQAHQLLGNEGTAEVLDNIKDMGFHYASKSGVTIAINDVEVPTQKQDIIKDAEADISDLDEMYMDGLVTEDDRYNQTVGIWTSANDKLTKAVEDNLSEYGGGKQGAMSNAGIGLYMMATSGAKGNIAQIKQMAGMRGLMSDPHGRIIERPIKSSFREGLSVLEYFISTHGARKGLTDTALRTADSGYMTRRLIDVAQELIVLEEDCGTLEGLLIETKRPDSILPPFEDRAKSRYAAEAVADPNTGEIMVERNELLSMETLAKIVEAGVSHVMVRSPIRCEAERGLCRMCYGLSLATWKPIMIGEAVGIIAAQSIGEPGTQLTMRTFHTGGIAGSDITSGLPRVNELFEARVPKGEAVLSEIDGAVMVNETTEGRIVEVVDTNTYTDEYVLPEGSSLMVDDGINVSMGDALATLEPDEDADVSESNSLMHNDILARVSGVSNVQQLLEVVSDDGHRVEYALPGDLVLAVNEGDNVDEANLLASGDILACASGIVQVYEINEALYALKITNTTGYSKEYEIPSELTLAVNDGDRVEEGDLLASGEVSTSISGIVHIQGNTLSISWTDEDKREYQIPAASALIVNSGDKVAAGDPLTAGPKSPQRILSLQGREAVQQYLIDEVQNVYRSQGVTIHDKHIEVIISQMLRKVKVEDSGDTNLLPDDDIDRKQFEEINASVLAEGGEPATASPVLLGITRASLKMDSFLSAASFQETTRVLTEAAVNSEVDYLRGLKENVIIGRLIPARLDLTEEGRAFLDIPEDEEEIDPISMLTGPVDEFESEMAQGPFGLGIESRPEDVMAASGMGTEELVEEQAPVGDD